MDDTQIGFLAAWQKTDKWLQLRGCPGWKNTPYFPHSFKWLNFQSLETQSTLREHAMWTVEKWKTSRSFFLILMERERFSACCLLLSSETADLFMPLCFSIVLCFIVRGVLCKVPTKWPIRIMRRVQQISPTPRPELGGFLMMWGAEFSWGELSQNDSFQTSF